MESSGILLCVQHWPPPRGGIITPSRAVSPRHHRTGALRAARVLRPRRRVVRFPISVPRPLRDVVHEPVSPHSLSPTLPTIVIAAVAAVTSAVAAPSPPLLVSPWAPRPPCACAHLRSPTLSAPRCRARRKG